MRSKRFTDHALRQFAGDLLQAAGLPAAKAEAVATVLVEGDLLGHDTHGLALLGGYLRELETGGMATEGEPAVLADAPAIVTWDGRRLPGPWLVLQAMELATARAARCGTGSVVIRRSHHIGCLAAYLQRATQRGLVMLLTCSDPNSASVAPYGGLDPVLTPNPLAAGFPAGEIPVLIDVSTSATTNGLTTRLHKEGAKLPAAWVIDGLGRPTDDPAVLFAHPPGTILPLGGMESGHKGYGLSLLVEALTGGLAGHGRADPPEGWGATVFLQILDPGACAGLEAFERQTAAVAGRCRAARPVVPGQPVRTPGERAQALARRQAAQGVDLHPSILAALSPWAGKLGVPMPAPAP